MEYRRLDFLSDVKEVVALIQRYLNPNYSEEILTWKHLESPFGRSVGLVAVEDNKIVGVVFAALYKFQNRSKEKLTSIRFFDACTHTDHRGKGIFKNLMKLGFEAHGEEFDFSFSNPNKASLKGHLRVGYLEPEKEIFYRLGIIQPLVKNGKGELRQFQDQGLGEKPLAKNNFFLSGNNLDFIKWRYQEKRYKILEYVQGDQIDYFIYRIEKKKGIRSIVLCDYFGDENRLNKILWKVCKKEKTPVLYYLENRITKQANLLISKKLKKAVVVFKYGKKELPENLVISLGDLEGRL